MAVEAWAYCGGNGSAAQFSGVMSMYHGAYFTVVMPIGTAWAIVMW